MKRYVIHAPNVHHGGGAILLSALLREFQTLSNSAELVANLDERMAVDETLNGKINIVRVKPTLWSRFLNEWHLYRGSSEDQVTVFFGNLPPLFPLQGIVRIYVQNKYLISSEQSLRSYTLRTQIRSGLERFWLKTFTRKCHQFYVQTLSMKEALSAFLKGKAAIEILGFADSLSEPRQDLDQQFDFIYVAAGGPHKNHDRLIEAWSLLADEDIFPVLCLTINDTHDIDTSTMLNSLDRLKEQKKVRIVNRSGLNREELLADFQASRALIYPSKFESFGLPLLEAKELNIPIVASELDYVRDLVDPVETFDPDSALSIARAVKRFLRLDPVAHKIYSPREAIESFFSGDN